MDHNYDKFITTPEFKRLSIANFVKKDSFNEKLKTVISNKNEQNKILEKVKVIWTKEFTKYFISKCGTINGGKYFSLCISIT